MLIIIYIITALLVLTGLQPLKIAGIFFGICYLPGLSLLALIRKDMLKMEDLILSFPASVGMSGLLTMVLLYAGIHVKFVACIIYAVTGLILLFETIKSRGVTSFRIELSGREIRFIIVALLATVLFSIPVISERISISHHGFHHLSIVTSIFNGFFPPDNPGMGGTAIGYQWGYHTLVAAISFPADLHPLRVFSILNIISLFFIFCLAYRSAKSFGISEGHCYLVPLAVIGLMRSDAVFFYAQKLMSGEFPPVENIASAPLNLLTSWVKGVSYLDTRLFFMNKFYNANNMPLGVCLSFTFFFILLMLIEEQVAEHKRNSYYILLAVVLIAIAVIYAFFLIVPLLFVPLWTVIILVTAQGGYREKCSQGLKLIIPCVIAAATVLPYLLLITDGSSVVTAGKSTSNFKFIYFNVQAVRNIIVFLLPSPFIIAGFWFAYKRFTFSRRFLFLLSGSVLFLLISIFLRLNWSNSVKFSYILLFFFSFFFVFTMSHIYMFFPNIWLKKVITGCIVLFLLATPILTEAAYICSPWFRDLTYTFRGRQVFFAQDESRNEAYRWIRDNTPPNALLLLPYLDTPYGITIAQAVSYRPSALAERSLFVIKDVYAYLRAEYEERVNMRKQLFEDPGNPRVRQYIASLKRPVYLLIEEGFEDPVMAGVEFDIDPEKLGKEFRLVFRNDKQRVFRLEY